MPWFSGGGSSGPATVQSDGVTLQGDGSAGNKLAIKQVETDASLTGAGTLATPLGITPATFLQHYFNSTATGLVATANTISIAGFELLVPFTLNAITLFITTVDAGNNSDVGIYNAAGTLLAHAGAQHFSAANTQTFAMIGGPIAIPAGRVLLAFTSAGSTLKISNSAQTAAWFYSASTGVSVGGALPASISAPVASVGFNSINFALS